MSLIIMTAETEKGWRAGPSQKNVLVFLVVSIKAEILKSNYFYVLLYKFDSGPIHYPLT